MTQPHFTFFGRILFLNRQTDILAAKKVNCDSSDKLIFYRRHNIIFHSHEKNTFNASQSE